MLCIFRGPTPLNMTAGKIQSDISIQIGKAEHSTTFQERQDGPYDLEDRLETLDEVKVRLSSENRVGVAVIEDMLTRGIGNLDIAPQQVLTGAETKRPGLRKLMLSPNLKKANGGPITIIDFPDDFQFGNGVTCNSTVTLKDGSSHLFSWCILSPATAALVEGDSLKYDALRQLMEG